MNTIFRNLSCLLILLLPFFAQAAEGRQKFGITVSTCGFDYDDENFCSDRRMRAFAKVMNERPANFVDGLLLYIYRSNHSVLKGLHSSYRMVVINKRKRTVEPFYWAFNPADEVVNPQGGHLEFQFDTQSKRFCVKGNIEAYRNTYHYADMENKQGFCFPYQGKKGDYAGFGWFEN